VSGSVVWWDVAIFGSTSGFLNTGRYSEIDQEVIHITGELPDDEEQTAEEN
jgi:hypothetical protein